MTYFRKGDIVKAVGVVQRASGISDNDVTVVFDGRSHSPEYLRAEMLTLVTPMLEVGDSVVGRHAFTKKDIEARIVFIHGEHIWVEESFPKFPNSPHQAIWRANDVTRVDPRPTKYEQPPSAPLDAETVKSLRRWPLADILDERKARDEAETPPAINPGEF